jgi:hypothetical protein
MCDRLLLEVNYGRRRPPTAGLLSRLWLRLKNEWIQDVPEEKAVCEFDCRKERCLFGDWSDCQWRFAHEALESVIDPASNPYFR